MSVHAAKLEALARPVPRYTSYPTAVQFTTDVGAADYADWLAATDPAEALSLYLHIPFCRDLCWYCGCNTKATRRHAPIAAYVETIEREIIAVAERLKSRRSVQHIHWGGGSPNSLAPSEIVRLGTLLRERFDVRAGAEFAVEIDPRFTDAQQLQAMRSVGVTRISVGVQDFDDGVQAAIGRMQSYELTRDVMALCRDAGIGSINIDLMYGLPGQTTESVLATIDKVIALSPERVAVFGYAHLPQRFRHQRLMPTVQLPGPVDRYQQSAAIGRRLVESGYVAIGLDHFVKPGDPLANGALARNFQGYTSDAANVLLGFGASAIGKLAQGYVQNATAVSDYARRIGDTGLAAARGYRLTDDDRVRAFAIERLMCDFALDHGDLARRFGTPAEPVIATAQALAAEGDDGHVIGTPSGIEITETGRPFVRTICSAFDTHWRAGSQNHSSGV